MSATSASGPGISGFACYLPRYRVALESWCGWTGDSWPKVRSVVGNSFRMRAPDENAYTMAASAVLRLILDYHVDPARIGYLALGTESSTDNSAGAVIVRGMVDQALVSMGRAPIRRSCEVPEFKHACLGGVYALKAAARYLALDGANQVAVVVCADVAEYERASSGEATQGAGAVAMLVEPQARMLRLDLAKSGNSSAYRGVDFRKPFARFLGQQPGPFAQPRDFPVFNGKYSTTCYLDAVLAAADDLFGRVGARPADYLRGMAAVFLHRPYQRMAETGLAFCYLLALARGDAADRAELAGHAAAAGADANALVDELISRPDLHALLVRDGHAAAEPFPNAAVVARWLRDGDVFAGLSTRLGEGVVKHTGNLYTASLPVWMAAGMADAAAAGVPLAGRNILTVGYGSGDAAEIVPMEVVPGWEDAARRVDFGDLLADPVDLDQDQYQALHAGQPFPGAIHRAGSFYIHSVGSRHGQHDDFGIEQYRYQS